MTTDELLQIEQGYSESKIQHICVAWFRRTFPSVALLLIAVPNGGCRSPRTGAQMVYEGQVKGVADLLLLYPSGGKSTLCIEMKVPKRKGRPAGCQSKEQKGWQALAERYGNVYEVCHGLAEFICAVCAYLRIPAEPYMSKALNEYPLYR